MFEQSSRISQFQPGGNSDGEGYCEKFRGICARHPLRAPGAVVQPMVCTCSTRSKLKGVCGLSGGIIEGGGTGGRSGSAHSRVWAGFYSKLHAPRDHGRSMLRFGLGGVSLAPALAVVVGVA